jgi:hypothetical protein
MKSPGEQDFFRMPPEQRRKFPSWEGLGVGYEGFIVPWNFILPTPNPSQEGNLAASPRKPYPELTLNKQYRKTCY